MEKDVPYDGLMEKDVPYFVYERTIARFERSLKRLIVAVIIEAVLICACAFMLYKNNAKWLEEWNKYDYSDVTVDGQDGGNANYMGDGASGVITNVEGDSPEEETEE